MRSRKSGHIIMLSSNVTQRSARGNGVYTVSKVAIDAMTRVLSKGRGPNGYPRERGGAGTDRTDMLAEALASSALRKQRPS
jgi:NAD(P)-dependent dehydrogenase (short-subunit alcohol dehydrogenase family)